MRKSTRNLLASLIAVALVIPVATPAQAARIKDPSANLKGTVIQDSLFGLHVNGAERGVWPTINFGSLRLWDNATSWTNIETSKGVFDWTNLDKVVADANTNGVTDIPDGSFWNPDLGNQPAQPNLLTGA